MKRVHILHSGTFISHGLVTLLVTAILGCSRRSPEIQLPFAKYAPSHVDGPGDVTTIVLTESGGMFLDGHSYETPEDAALAAKSDMKGSTSLDLAADRNVRVSHALALCSAVASLGIQRIGTEVATGPQACSLLSFSPFDPHEEQMWLIERTPDTIKLTGRELGIQDLDRILTRIAAHRIDTPVCIVPAPSLSYYELVEILDLCTKANLLNLHVTARVPFTIEEIKE